MPWWVRGWLLVAAGVVVDVGRRQVREVVPLSRLVGAVFLALFIVSAAAGAVRAAALGQWGAAAVGVGGTALFAVPGLWWLWRTRHRFAAAPDGATVCTARRGPATVPVLLVGALVACGLADPASSAVDHLRAGGTSRRLIWWPPAIIAARWTRRVLSDTRDAAWQR